MDIYRLYYLRNLFCMHRTKTRGIYANLLQVAITGGKITRLFAFSILCSAFKNFLTSALKIFVHIFLCNFEFYKKCLLHKHTMVVAHSIREPVPFQLRKSSSETCYFSFN